MQKTPFILLIFLSTALFAFNGEKISEKIMKKAERKYGGKVVSRFLKYNKLLTRAEHMQERNKLQIVNTFFNQVPFVSDKTNWKQEDYWATPLEFLARAKGDSEDYAIAKYFALTTLGIDAKKLYFTYVSSNAYKGSHMVLSYFESPQAEPYILDNSTTDILSASERTDLTPIYQFNPAGDKAADSKELQQSTHKKWEKLYKRVQRNKL